MSPFWAFDCLMLTSGWGNAVVGLLFHKQKAECVIAKLKGIIIHHGIARRSTGIINFMQKCIAVYCDLLKVSRSGMPRASAQCT